MAPFCSCPASLVSRICFAVGPGCAKCSFFVALPRAPRPFGGARAKKKHHPGCFLFCSGLGERQGKEKPRWAPARGQSTKKTPPRVFFFWLRPGERQGKEKPRWAPARGSARRGHSKKKKKRVVFVSLLRPRADAHSLTAGLGGDASARRGHSKTKKTPRVVFFLLRPRADAHSLTAGLGGNASARRGHSKQKKHPGWCFFCFLLRPRRVFLDNSKKMSGVLHRV